MYTAACFAPDCPWTLDCDTYRDALIAGERHRDEQVLHKTYVIRRDETRKPA